MCKAFQCSIKTGCSRMSGPLRINSDSKHHPELESSTGAADETKQSTYFAVNR